MTDHTPAASPLVSVILPTFNRSEVLDRAIRSVLSQTYRNLELIVVDDASTDDTAELVRRNVDSRVRYMANDRRKGAAGARNAGVRASRGEVLAFQDSDDEWLPEKLDTQVSLLLSCGPEVGWVGGGYEMMVDERPVRITSPNLLSGRSHELDLLDGRPFVTPVWLVRRRSLLQAGPFDESLESLEDWDLIFRLDAVCEFRAVKGPVLIKHGSADSLFGDRPRRLAALETILTRHRERWLRCPPMYAHFHNELGRLYGLQGDRAAARRCHREAMALDRWQPRTYALLAGTSSRSRIVRGLGRRLQGPADQPRPTRLFGFATAERTSTWPGRLRGRWRSTRT